MPKATLEASVTQLLRASGVQGVAWAPGTGTAAGNPFYKQIPEPAPSTPLGAASFPFVVFDITGDGEVEQTFETPYSERYRLEVDEIGLQSQIDSEASPYTLGSVLEYLDSLRQTPRVLDGDNFIVTTFYRTDPWDLSFEENRGPTGERVWTAKGVYLVELTKQGL